MLKCTSKNKNYSPVSEEIHFSLKAWHANKKMHTKMWGTAFSYLKLLPNEYCTALTQGKSNLAVRIASLQRKLILEWCHIFWNVAAAPNYQLPSTNKISASKWWKTTYLTTALNSNRSWQQRFLGACLGLDKMLQPEKVKKNRCWQCYLNMFFSFTFTLKSLSVVYS